MSKFYETRPDKYIKPVYNDGVVTLFSKTPKKDKFNTPIRGEYTESEVVKHWFRRLGVTIQDTYYSSADDKEVKEKIAIKGNQQIDCKLMAKAFKKSYEIYRVYFNANKNETEISLVEVE